jgi:hypothetical protein
MTGHGLSGDWTGQIHRHLRGRPDSARLAIMLAPVQAAIRVVDPRNPPMRVLWATVGTRGDDLPYSQSYTDFRGGEIRINPLPVLEDKLDPDDQVDVCVGQGLHEATHSRHTRDLWFSTLLRTGPDGREEPAFEPLRIAGWLLNIAEDIRGEGVTAADWPGFAPYFGRLLDWLWSEEMRRESTLPATTGHTVAERLRIAFFGARFRDRFHPADPEVAAECAWWRDWIDDYTAGRATPAETVRRGLDHVGEDPEAEAEMAGMAAQEAEARRAGEALRKLLEQLLREGVEGVEACASDGPEASGLTGSEGAEIEELVREGLTAVSPVIRHRGSAMPQVRVRKPVETAASRREFIGRPGPLVEAMRAALVFRPAVPRHDMKLQRRGDLDDEELWRWGTGDDRVFTERMVESRPDTALGLLVDISGSMLGCTEGGGVKVGTAQRLAQILLAAALDTEGVTPCVWAHTGDSGAGHGCDVFTVWEPGDPATRLGLIASLDHGNNYDGYALAVAVDRMRAMEQPQKVLLVLSDGYPAGHGYGGVEAAAHILSVCRWAESQGVTVIQIAIDEALRPDDQAAMYGDGNWLPYTSDAQVPRDLVAVLGRYVR